MAVRHRLIRRPPAAVWAVLADGSRYGDWVVGPDSSREVGKDWPELGSTIEYTVRLGPWKGSAKTTVRDVDPTRRIELEADSGKLGTARIAIEVRPWGRQTLVTVDEHPLRGPGAALHNAALDAPLRPAPGVAQSACLLACLGRQNIRAHIRARRPPTHHSTVMNASRLSPASGEPPVVAKNARAVSAVPSAMPR